MGSVALKEWAEDENWLIDYSDDIDWIDWASVGPGVEIKYIHGSKGNPEEIRVGWSKNGTDYLSVIHFPSPRPTKTRGFWKELKERTRGK